MEAAPSRSGGYHLSRFPPEITVLEVIEAIEGDMVGKTRAAQAWQECLEGGQRVARTAFSWVRGRSLEGVSFDRTPGPGDGEGGDVYPP